MTTKTRKSRYPKRFRIKAIELFNEQKTAEAVARELNINVHTVKAWESKYYKSLHFRESNPTKPNKSPAPTPTVSRALGMLVMALRHKLRLVRSK